MSATHLPASNLRTTTLTPYLQLPHLLSLTWLAYPILSLLFVAFRLQISAASAQDAVSSAKDDLLASCQAAEKAATSAASLPRYMAIATNQRIADAVNGTMNGARAALVLALTVMEAIINFIVDTYRSTFLCFLELVIRGALSILIKIVQEITSAVQSIASGIATTISDLISGVNSVITKVGIKAFDVPDLSSLTNFTASNDVLNALQNLNNSLPTLSDLKNSIDDLIDTPFELLKKDINDTFAGLSFDSNALPVPEQNTVSFCAQMDTSVVDDLGHDLIKIAKIGVVLLVILALILVAANCALEWYKWRCLKYHLRYTREAWATDPAIFHPGGKSNSMPTLQLSDHNLLMLQGNMMHPLLTKIANRISTLLRLSPSKHIHLTWFFHYVFHPPALACFLIGFFGLLSIQVQLLAISPLEHKYQTQAQASTQDFSNLIATSVNASMYNQSAAYATDINGRVDTVQSTINDGLFGWVNGTTTTLNNTINAFYTDLQNAVGTVFNGTILEEPVQEFIRCFIGSKVDAIEDALTFLHNNLIIDIPRVNDTVLVLSPADVNEATQPIAAAAIGGGNGNNEGVVGKLVNTYTESLKKERIMFSVFMGLWGLVVLMALAVVFWHSYGRNWMESYKKRKWQKKQRAGIDGLVVPFRTPRGEDHASSSVKGADVEKADQSFAPEPAAKPSFFSNFRPKKAVGDESTSDLHPYPSGGGRPEFQKSWESILDQANTSGHTVPQETRETPKISAPRKLISFGKPSTQDPEAETSDSERHWFSMFTTKKGKKGEMDEVPVEDPSTQERVRPKLTVTTSNGSVKSFGSNPEDREVPTSAWSVSPRQPTWKSNLAIPKFPGLRNRTDGTANDTEPAQSQSQSQDAFAVPLHHGFPKATLPPPPPNFQLPAYTGPTPTYTNRHLSNGTSLPTPPGLTQPFNGLVSPTKSHARHRSSANPFATPFDDDRYAAANQSPLSPSSGRKSVGMAL